MPPSPATDPALLLLAAIRDELHALRAELAAAGRTKPKAPLLPADEARLLVLLPAIDAALGNRTFPVRELFQFTRMDSAPAIALRKILRSIGGGDRRAVGRLLSRAIDRDIAGFRVTASPPTRDGILWTLRRVVTESSHS